MNDWLLLIAASVAGSLVSLTGGMILLARRLSVEKVQRIAVPFAAGALLAAAFINLLPEALRQGESTVKTTTLVLSGLLLFFVLERFLGWFHHHHDHGQVQGWRLKRAESTRLLVIIGDTLHNAIDGMVIGAAFLADPAIGIATTFAIAAHEIPQEIGDFGILLAMGMRRRTVFFVNIISAVATVIGAVAIYGLGLSLPPYWEAALLAIAAGTFIYIAASDLIPTIHDEPKAMIANYQTLILLVGIVVVGIASSVAHEYVDAQHVDNGTEATQQHSDQELHRHEQ